MITANHIVHDVIEIASSGGNPNEFKISKEQVLFWVNEVRAQLISQKIKKREDISDSWIQWIPCLELEPVDESECCDYPTGCNVMRSKTTIPVTIDVSMDNSIVSVSTVDNQSISKTNTSKNKYQAYGKFAGKTRGWFLKDDYLYITNDADLEVVQVSGVFESPEDLSGYLNCSTGDACYTSDSAYPVGLPMASQITDIIIKTKVAPFMTLSMDNTNDANGSTDEQKANEKKANT